MKNVRPATFLDLQAITDIYNQAILNTTATFDTEIKSLEDRETWFTNRDENFPILVIEFNNSIVGYAALNKWSERKAYDITAEISIYISEGFRGQGLGKILLNTITLAARNSKLNSLLARITEGNEQSIYMHQNVDFITVGVMKKVGEKFGRKLDVTMMQLMLK
jgi:phosphinothricin acetyltransferase